VKDVNSTGGSGMTTAEELRLQQIVHDLQTISGSVGILFSVAETLSHIESMVAAGDLRRGWYLDQLLEASRLSAIALGEVLAGVVAEAAELDWGIAE
jgi:hypothetical protein